jgi:hypothetical protein
MGWLSTVLTALASSERPDVEKNKIETYKAEEAREVPRKSPHSSEQDAGDRH